MVNGAVFPDFSQSPNELTLASKSSVVSLKRPHSAMGAIVLPEFGIPIKRKAPVSQAVGTSSSSSEEVRNSAPETAVSAPNFQQVKRPRQPQGPPQVISQVTPEETPATVLPNKTHIESAKL